MTDTLTHRTLPQPRASVLALADDVVATRRELHRHAELSTEEWRTQALILNWLTNVGLDDVRAVADTGVTGIVRGARPGENVLWRADIDALPLKEDTGLPFACESGEAMHACAHDGHTAIALAMASVLQAQREQLAGSVRFAFQPAEERIGGAKRMIDEGVMDSPRIDRVFGLHIWGENDLGHVLVAPGPVFAAATHIRIIIRGRGGHAAAPHQAIDPILIAAHAIVALQSIVSRSVNPAETAVFTIGRIEGGVRGNIIPDEVMMSGTIRTYEARVLERMLARVEEVLRGVTSAWGGEYRFDHSTLPAVVNDASCAALVAEVAGAFLGADSVGEKRATGADDMALFLERAPGAYFMLGARPLDGRRTYPHHHPKFDFDEACLPVGIELGLRIVEKATGSDLS